MNQGINNLFCGDGKELMKLIPDNSVDLVYTDPPYFYPTAKIKNINKDKNYSIIIRKTKISNKILNELNVAQEGDYQYGLNEFKRVTKDSRMMIWCNKYMLRNILNGIFANKLNFEILLWIKTNPIPCNNPVLFDKEYCVFIYDKSLGFDKSKGTYDNRRTFYYDHTINTEKTIYDKHPSIKPFKMVTDMLEKFTNQGDLVLDPFAGSGTTLKACESLGRNGLGAEILPKYQLTIKEKLAKIQYRMEL